MTARGPIACAVRGLTKRYEPTAAVTDVSFTVAFGTVAALVGPPGAGKTTIVRALLGLTLPTSGTASVHGLASSIPAPTRASSTGAPPGHDTPQSARLVGSVLATRGLHPARTARDHLWIYAAAAGVADTRVAEVLELVELTEQATTRARALSIWQQTRLALATALLSDPPVLVLDEPMAGLEHRERGWLLDYLRRHARRGGSAVLTSDSLSAVLPGTDDLIVLNQGAVAYHGSPARLRRRYPDRVVVGTPAPVALATVLAAHGFADAVIRADGRLAVAEATVAQIRTAAATAGARLDDISMDPISPDRVLAALTRPTAPTAPRRHGPAETGARYSPSIPYGIPR
ncbi:ABC transporter ATP-binding protein [Nocardia sp. CNY236]|uniref:ABC transporter ATP-binding protein n=1 Tax=Nocardia sp. CNY236 TaxID=1169152 RepID=UPI0003F85D75|nr:ABC transporter ATP-binding protein [Nocardia sp. CNY236]